LPLWAVPDGGVRLVLRHGGGASSQGSCARRASLGLPATLNSGETGARQGADAPIVLRNAAGCHDGHSLVSSRTRRSRSRPPANLGPGAYGERPASVPSAQLGTQTAHAQPSRLSERRRDVGLRGRAVRAWHACRRRFDFGGTLVVNTTGHADLLLANHDGRAETSVRHRFPAGTTAFTSRRRVSNRSPRSSRWSSRIQSPDQLGDLKARTALIPPAHRCRGRSPCGASGQALLGPARRTSFRRAPARTLRVADGFAGDEHQAKRPLVVEGLTSSGSPDLTLRWRMRS